jgi:hypothetical protein
MGKAHDILVDFDNSAWHCPGRRDSVSGGILGRFFSLVRYLSSSSVHRIAIRIYAIELTGRDC